MLFIPSEDKVIYYESEKLFEGLDIGDIKYIKQI